MSELVTLEQAKTHLRVTDASANDEISLLLDTAESIVFTHIGFADVAELYAEFGESELFPLEAAVKLVLTQLYDKRDENPLSDAARALLEPWRSSPGVF